MGIVFGLPDWSIMRQKKTVIMGYQICRQAAIMGEYSQPAWGSRQILHGKFLPGKA